MPCPGETQTILISPSYLQQTFSICQVLLQRATEDLFAFERIGEAVSKIIMFVASVLNMIHPKYQTNKKLRIGKIIIEFFTLYGVPYLFIHVFYA